MSKDFSQMKQTQLAALNFQITALEEQGLGLHDITVAILPAAVLWTALVTAAGTLCLANRITAEQEERIIQLAKEIAGENQTTTLDTLLEKRRKIIFGMSENGSAYESE